MNTTSIDPRRTALINVDLQICFVEGTPLSAPDGLAIVGTVNRLGRAARAAGAQVVHTRGWLNRDGSDVGVLISRVPPFIRALYTAGAPTAELHPALEIDPNDVVQDKTGYGAFTGTDLEARLRSQGIDTVLITGIATNICCETTAREAAARDFHVYFVADATTTFEMHGVPGEQLHAATSASLAQVFADIVTTEQMIDALAQHADAVAR
ncbi:MAG: cysteine hydrolase family protein [Jatrophihabitantaceae bacterium]